MKLLAWIRRRMNLCSVCHQVTRRPGTRFCSDECEADAVEWMTFQA